MEHPETLPGGRNAKHSVNNNNSNNQISKRSNIMNATTFIRRGLVAALVIFLISAIGFSQGILKNGSVVRNTGTITYKEVQNYKGTAGTIVNSGTFNITGGSGNLLNQSGALAGTVKNYIGGQGSGGTIVVAGNIDNNLAGAKIDNDSTGGFSTIKVAGSITNAGTFTTTHGRIIYNSAAPQSILLTTYGALVTDVASAKSLAAGTTIVNDSLRVDGGSTFTVGANTLTLDGATNVTQDGGIFSANAGTVDYHGDQNQSMIAAQYKTLTLTGATAARTKTSPAGLSFVAAGSLTVDTHDTLLVASGNLDMSVATTTLANSGVIKVAGNATFNASITSAGTFYYNGALAQNIGAATYADLVLGNAGSKTFPNGTTAVTGNFTINGGAGARSYGTGTFQFAGTTGNQAVTNLAESFYIVQFAGAATKSLTGTAFSANQMDLNNGTGVVTNNVTTVTLTNVGLVSLTLAAGTELDNSLGMTINMSGDLQNDGTLVNAGTIGVY